MRGRSASLALTLVMLTGPAVATTAAAQAPEAPACHAGAYALADGEVLDISATGKPSVLRWHRMDGRTGTLERNDDGAWRGRSGWTSRADSLAVTFGPCSAREIRFGDAAARRVDLEVTDTTFRSGDLSLRGRLVNAGHGPEVLAKARAVTDATAEVMARRSPQAYAALGQLRQQYRSAPWWADMQGEYTGQLLRYPVWLTRLVLPRFDQGTPWRHDPLPVLQSVDAPQLWMIADDDAQAPPERTLEQLATLAAQGRPITTAVFPDTDHGLVEFETAADGTRTRTRHADGALRMAIDFIRDGRVRADGYGRVRIASGPIAP